jgi:hypothetical protein
MKDEEVNDPAAIVTGETQSKQVADIRDRWWWVEHSAWTQRMLTRLEESEPTAVRLDGLRREGCLVWNTAFAPMVSLMETPLTGEPDAGNPPVRFGGRGGVNHAIPTPIFRKIHGYRASPSQNSRGVTDQAPL